MPKSRDILTLGELEKRKDKLIARARSHDSEYTSQDLLDDCKTLESYFLTTYGDHSILATIATAGSITEPFEGFGNYLTVYKFMHDLSNARNEDDILEALNWLGWSVGTAKASVWLKGLLTTWFHGAWWINAAVAPIAVVSYMLGGAKGVLDTHATQFKEAHERYYDDRLLGAKIRNLRDKLKDGSLDGYLKSWATTDEYPIFWQESDEKGLLPGLFTRVFSQRAINYAEPLADSWKRREAANESIRMCLNSIYKEQTEPIEKQILDYHRSISEEFRKLAVIVRAKVIDPNDHQPVARADVSVKGLSSSWVVTDPEGGFQLQIPFMEFQAEGKEASIILEISKTGYEPLEYKVTLDENVKEIFPL